MNKIIKISIMTIFSWLLLTSCSSKEECYYFPGSDRIELLDTVKKGNTFYHLIVRTTGFQDKASVFELYDARPNFTTCGEADRKPIWVEDIDDDVPGKFVKKVILHEQTERKLEIVYTTDKNEASDLYKIKLSQE